MMRAALALSLLCSTAPVLAQPAGEAPRWLRHPAIAPDGETLSFTHRGQIFLVDATGGLAVPVTRPDSYSYGAVWSPDSEQLAFASDANGDDDVFIADFSGSLRRMTWSSAAEIPTSFTPDGTGLLYTAPRLGDAERSTQGALSMLPQLYAVDVAGGRETLVLPNLALQASWNRDQTRLVYTYNPSGDPADRQHRVAANARQIWFYDAQSGKHEPVFAVDGVDRQNPVWSPDGQSLFYLSEASGWLNVWQVDLASGTETQITRFSEGPVRDLSIANNGTIAFSHGGRIYVRNADAKEPQAIEILTLDQRLSGSGNFRATKTSGFVSSPDGARFALIANADVFLMDREGLYRQVTATAGEERNVTFSPDGSKLVYAAQRGHEWGLYMVEVEPESDELTLPLHYEETPLLVPENGNAFQPQFSPDGSKIAFIADRREVKVLNLDSGEVTTLFGPDSYNTSYIDGDLWFSWSPTSQDLLVQWRTIIGAEESRAAIVPADGSAAPRPIARAAGSFTNGFWSLDGTQVIGSTYQYSARSAQLHSLTADLYRVFLSEAAREDFLDIYKGNFPQVEAEAQADAAGEGEEDAEEYYGYAPLRYAFTENRPQRLEGRLTDNNTYPMVVAPLPDYQNLLMVSPADNDDYDISIIDLSTGATDVIQSVTAPNLMAVSFVPELGVIDFKLADQILTVTPGQPDQTVVIPATIYYASNLDQVREAAFEQAWADLKYKYYQTELEGRDWDAIGQQYRSYLGSIASHRELKELISAMYGELSASHLYVTYSGQNPGQTGLGTYNDVLGVYLDYGYDGPGRRVADILPGGPLSRLGDGVGPGDIITSINGQAVPEAGGIERLLDVNLGKRVRVGLIDAEGGEERFISAYPIDRRAEWQLSRQRLVDVRRDYVDRLSNQCIAYVHVPAMNNDAYLDVLGRLGAARGVAKAALIDVRSNGGGNLTRELITLLTGEPYSTVGVDGRPFNHEPNNRWIWPSAIVVDSFGYSDGSVFPQAYHDLKIGPIVGDVVLNTGTAVNYIDSALVPDLNYGIPVLPNRRLDGSYYENSIVPPDIHVPFDPNQTGIGVDPQLEAAIEALMGQIGTDADCRLR
ncbi:MAG: hypothetical protein ABS75_26345 [Pelagibacterium sp. SCN 63-23]|nr:MAG: hypothetical protein ABS75_26345 [Pelagibacterium sp. SCN 63-23]